MKKNSLIVLVLMSLGLSQLISADAGDVLAPTFLGATIGGIAGGGRGAGIGAGVGLGVGLLNNAARNRRQQVIYDDYGYDNDYYVDQDVVYVDQYGNELYQPQTQRVVYAQPNVRRVTTTRVNPNANITRYQRTVRTR